MNDDRLREALARLRGGSAAAFEQIYTELSTPLFTVILRITFLTVSQQPFLWTLHYYRMSKFS